MFAKQATAFLTGIPFSSEGIALATSRPRISKSFNHQNESLTTVNSTNSLSNRSDLNIYPSIQLSPLSENEVIANTNGLKRGENCRSNQYIESMNNNLSPIEVITTNGSTHSSVNPPPSLQVPSFQSTKDESVERPNESSQATLINNKELNSNSISENQSNPNLPTTTIAATTTTTTTTTTATATTVTNPSGTPTTTAAELTPTSTELSLRIPRNRTALKFLSTIPFDSSNRQGLSAYELTRHRHYLKNASKKSKHSDRTFRSAFSKRKLSRTINSLTGNNNEDHKDRSRSRSRSSQDRSDDNDSDNRLKKKKRKTKRGKVIRVRSKNRRSTFSSALSNDRIFFASKGLPFFSFSVLKYKHQPLDDEDSAIFGKSSKATGALSPTPLLASLFRHTQHNNTSSVHQEPGWLYSNDSMRGFDKGSSSSSSSSSNNDSDDYDNDDDNDNDDNKTIKGNEDGRGKVSMASKSGRKNEKDESSLGLNNENTNMGSRSRAGGTSISTKVVRKRRRRRGPGRRRKGLSFELLINCQWDWDIVHPNIVQDRYDPFFLDDPTLHTGKNKRIIALPGYISSIVPYVRQSTLKEELNEQFLLQHPWIAPSLTLSKIRNLKKALVKISLDTTYSLSSLLSKWLPTIEEKTQLKHKDLQTLPDEALDVQLKLGLGITDPTLRSQLIEEIKRPIYCVELTTVAYTFVLLEKLILKQLVNKQNRKLIACTCLFLAHKFIDRQEHREGGTTQDLRDSQIKLLAAMEKIMGVVKADILRFEFPVFAALCFQLLIPVSEIWPHFERILAAEEITVNKYFSSRPDLLHAMADIQIVNDDGEVLYDIDDIGMEDDDDDDDDDINMNNKEENDV